jgi:hypothetical protein
MADQQPGGDTPAAGMPDPAEVDGGAVAPDPTRVDDPAPAGTLPTAARHTPGGPGPTGAPGAADRTSMGESSTAEAPARWRASAAVPAAQPKRSRWSRRRTGPDSTAVDPDDWAAIPPVDPWADQDTPWVPLPPPTPEGLPPTRVDAPMPPRAGAPMPPTRVEPALTPADTTPGPSPAAPQQQAAPPAGSPAAAPLGVAATRRRRRWGRRKHDGQTATVDRLPVQPRQATGPGGSPPQGASHPAVPPQGRPGPPPPTPWRAPAAPSAPPISARPPTAADRPFPPPRRKRRRGRRFLLFVLLSAVCCCGIPGYFAWPAAHQYPVSAVLPESVGDLTLSDDSAGRRAADALSRELTDSNLPDQETFAGVYTDGHGKRVTIFGTTGLRLTPERDLEAELTHLAGNYDITDVEPFDLDEAGAHERCGVGRSGPGGVVVCAWADHGSLGAVLLTRRNVTESAHLAGDLRRAVLIRG